jgi:hypothetical protein
VITECTRALVGADDADAGFIARLGGGHAAVVLDDDRDDQHYWLRVWAARGLLWACDGQPVPTQTIAALRAGLHDPTWRVREMCAKVIARHVVGELFAAVAVARDDPVPRVRLAAARAVETLSRHDA